MLLYLDLTVQKPVLQTFHNTRFATLRFKAGVANISQHPLWNFKVWRVLNGGRALRTLFGNTRNKAQYWTCAWILRVLGRFLQAYFSILLGKKIIMIIEQLLYRWNMLLAISFNVFMSVYLKGACWKTQDLDQVFPPRIQFDPFWTCQLPPLVTLARVKGHVFMLISTF